MPAGYPDTDAVMVGLTIWLVNGVYLTILFMLQAWRMEKMDAIDISRYDYRSDPAPVLRMSTAWKVLFVFFAWTPMIQMCAAMGFTALYLWMGFVMKQNLLALPPQYAKWNREIKAMDKVKAESKAKALSPN